MAHGGRRINDLTVTSALTAQLVLRAFFYNYYLEDVGRIKVLSFECLIHVKTWLKKSHLHF